LFAAPDLKIINATVRWTVAADGWTEANIYFCQRQKCKQIWLAAFILPGTATGQQHKITPIQPDGRFIIQYQICFQNRCRECS